MLYPILIDYVSLMLWNWYCSYRKFNLFNEDHQVRRTMKPDVAIFETDFGVKFGLMVCFDLLFSAPIQQLYDAGVRNFAVPSMWYSELPFNTGMYINSDLFNTSTILILINSNIYWTALQIQQGIAYSRDVNLLVAGASVPTQGSTGSGIYSGKFGALKAIIVDIPTTRVLVTDVPKVPSTAIVVEAPKPSSARLRADTAAEPVTLHLMNEDLTNGYEARWLKFQENNTQADKVCQNSFCCSYNVRATLPAGDAPSTVCIFDGHTCSISILDQPYFLFSPSIRTLWSLSTVHDNKSIQKQIMALKLASKHALFSHAP